MPTEPHLKGTIVLHNDVGRALRNKPAPVRSSSVVDCCGEFRAGNCINITFRGADGGQFAIATAIAGMSAADLRARISRRSRDAMQDSDAVVIAERDLKLLWPRLRDV